MQKLILTVLLCTFIASPVFANNLVVEQANMLNKIAVEMENAQGDAAHIDYLTNKKSCIEEAVNLDGLKECIIKFPAAKLKTLGTAKN